MKLDKPKTGEKLRATHPSKTVLRFLSQRRSTLARCMRGPGPDKTELNQILRLAARVPDHRKLAPWRFIVFKGKARADFGVHLANKFAKDNPDMDAERVQFEADRFLRAPLVIALISSPKDCPRGTPKWEQELSAGAVGMNMLHATRALGYAAQWLTEWYAFDSEIAGKLGLTETERVAGFIYIGTAAENPVERARPQLSSLTEYWNK